MTSRSDNRKQLRARRRALTHRERLQCSQALCLQLASQPWFRNSNNIAAYLPADGEIDPRTLIELAWRMNKAVYLSVLVPHLDNQIWFVRYTSDTRLVRNRFGIAEPEIMHRQRIRTQGLDLVLTPLVGFDARGNRLGMGGGFYDRTLAGIEKPLLVGLAHSVQELRQVPRDDWDVPLDFVVTNKALHRCQGQL